MDCVDCGVFYVCFLCVGVFLRVLMSLVSVCWMLLVFLCLVRLCELGWVMIM